MGSTVSSLIHQFTWPKVLGFYTTICLSTQCCCNTLVEGPCTRTTNFSPAAGNCCRDPLRSGNHRRCSASQTYHRLVNTSTCVCTADKALDSITRFRHQTCSIPASSYAAVCRYPTLDKPSWTPPAPLFGQAWSVFYAVMGYASYLVWKQGGIEAQKRPLTFYGLQLVFNLCWPITFFLRKKLGQAQIVNLGETAITTCGESLLHLGWHLPG